MNHDGLDLIYAHYISRCNVNHLYISPYNAVAALQATPLFSVLLEKALELIENCNCKPASGCPGCVQHTDCGEYNAVLNKFSAIIVLQCTIEAEAEHRERLRLQQQVQLGP